MISADQQLTRIQNKLGRLAEDFREMAGDGTEELDDLADSFQELSEINRQDIIDLGMMVYLKAVRVKLDVYRLVADLGDLDAFDQASVTIDEIEEFYREIEEEMAWPFEGGVQEGGPKLLTYIPPLPEKDRKPDFDIGAVDDPRLFRSISAFFEDVSDGVAVDIP